VDSSSLAIAHEASLENCIFVGGLPLQADDFHLLKYFREFGTVAEAAVVRHKKTNQSRRFGFVSFAEREVRHDFSSQQRTIVVNVTSCYEGKLRLSSLKLILLNEVAVPQLQILKIIIFFHSVFDII
jgi:RNA recognition motif-containing protein